MDVETAIQAFASAGNDLPREAMQWALDHWDEVAPGLLSVLERFASGADRSNDAASTVFFILHLAGEKQDTRVFTLLCSLAQDGEPLRRRWATTSRPPSSLSWSGPMMGIWTPSQA